MRAEPACQPESEDMAVSYSISFFARSFYCKVGWHLCVAGEIACSSAIWPARRVEEISVVPRACLFIFDTCALCLVILRHCFFWVWFHRMCFVVSLRIRLQSMIVKRLDPSSRLVCRINLVVRNPSQSADRGDIF